MDADAPFDTRALREALGWFPTGIALITAAPPAQAGNLKGVAEASHIGITVNSFASVSLEPPLVLWCIDRRSRRYPAFANAPGFTVSILAAGHKAVSARLAGAGEHSLDGIALMETELGPPALADSLAVFECARESVQDAGDHAILIGRVLRFGRHEGAGAPLVYFRGRYGALAQGEPPEGVNGRRTTDQD
ncbi:MAG TPA: flavin reductase family protein [Rhizomicrobium sp.]|jgi:flavin reductase (DIM6/NTAB) family NADH-FMN oxidoreductase RutF|nr:flavin reductase family protein [Rhizomicrobium sp.]